MSHPVKKRTGMTVIGHEVANAVKPAFEERGFAVGEILRDWPEIVGRDMAAFTAPERVNWPRRPAEDAEAPPRGRRPDGATLVIRVDGPRAIEAQHRSDVILERINTYFGWRAVASLRFLQAPVVRSTPRKRRGEPPSPATIARAEAGLTGVRAPGLRHALARLRAQLDRDEA